MVEPITTVAATTAASAQGASTASTGVAAGAVASSSAPTTVAAFKPEEVIRRLASAMLYNGEMQVVNQSEIVDEFAAPIYTGLAAATPATNTTPSSGESSMKLAGPGGGNKLPIDASVSDKGIDHIHDDALPDTINDTYDILELETSAGPQVSDVPEIQYLLENYYQAPSVETQLQSDASKIVVERNVIDEKIHYDGKKKTAICWIEEKTVDRKYLEYGNLSDVISELRHGNIPTIRQIYLAIIDLTDLATMKAFRPYLLKYKLENAQFQIRELSADMEKKSLHDKLPVETPSQYRIDRQVESRSFYKTDRVTERIGHKEVSTERHLDLVAVNIKNVCTKEMSKSELNQFIARRNELIDLFGSENAINRIETIFSPEQIATINKSAMVWTYENILTSTTEYTEDHYFHRYLTDLKGFLGEKVTTSDKQVSISEQKTLSEYLSESDNINLANINTYEDALVKFASLQKTASLNFDPNLVANYIEPSGGVRFDDGWITYIPGGSIANLGAKSSLGANLNGWDYFWAGVDVATIAVAVASFGASSAATAAGKSAVAGGAKTGMKAVAKAGTKAGAKAAAKASAKAGTSVAIQNTIKHTGKVTLANAGKKAGLKATAQTGAKSLAKVTTKTGFKPNAKYIKNGFAYLTDKQGRVIKATGKLKNVPGIRNQANQKAAALMGKIGDEGGHLIPANYGGPGSLINHVPQARNVNRSAIKRIENEMGRALKAGKNVEYTIMPHYPNANTLRPDKFTIRYTIDGVQKIRRIANV